MSEQPLTANKPIRTLVVEDDPLARHALRGLIEGMEGILLVGEASAASEVMERIRTVSPDVVLMDLHMAGISGLQLTRGLVQQIPDIRVLVVSVLPENPYALEALKAGAAGYIRKEKAPEHLQEAIYRVSRGETYLSPAVAPALLRQLVRSQEAVTASVSLTPKEREVLHLVAEGRSNKEIATELKSTIRTVKAHVSRILRKLNVDDRTQAAIFAVRLGLVDEQPARHEPFETK